MDETEARIAAAEGIARARTKIRFGDQVHLAKLTAVERVREMRDKVRTDTAYRGRHYLIRSALVAHGTRAGEASELALEILVAMNSSGVGWDE